MCLPVVENMLSTFHVVNVPDTLIHLHRLTTYFSIHNDALNYFSHIIYGEQQS